MINLKQIANLLTLLALFGFKTSSVSAQKIGFVSFDSVIYFMPEIENVNVKLDSFKRTYEYMIEETKAEYFDKKSKLDSLVKVNANPKILEQKQSQLQRIYETLQSYDQAFQEDGAKYQEELLKPLRAKVIKTVEDIAKANGYATVLDRSVAYYVSPADNLTSIVMKKLNCVIPPKINPMGTPGMGQPQR